MPYFIGNKIDNSNRPLWGEEFAYKSEILYSIDKNKKPPVNYKTHIINSHSITHAEGSLHTNASGKSIDQYFENSSYFFGKAVVIRLDGNKYSKIDEKDKIFHWVVEKDEIIQKFSKLNLDTENISKVILTTNEYPVDAHGFHDPNYVLTLSIDAAEFLVNMPNFNLFGTSWKSTDYQPNSMNRPVHNIIFKKAIIFELLDLKVVPEGEYFFVGVPLNIFGASESPVNPILLSKNEIF